jgi:hypothetical protein
LSTITATIDQISKDEKCEYMKTGQWQFDASIWIGKALFSIPAGMLISSTGYVRAITAIGFFLACVGTLLTPLGLYSGLVQVYIISPKTFVVSGKRFNSNLFFFFFTYQLLMN